MDQQWRLMDAGVPIKDMVAGIAMGLLHDARLDKFQAITDITGFEDALVLWILKLQEQDSVLMQFKWILNIKVGFLAKYLNKL